jgi:hypothetical protein
MITHNQLLKHKFVSVNGANDKSPLYLHGLVNGTLCGGVFHFPMIGEWHQAKNINHLKHLYLKCTGEKLDKMNDNEWIIINGLIN